jgi:predicted transcriptional regulator
VTAQVLLTRDQILDYVTKHPGSYLRQIKRELHLPMGVIQYQLYSLEKERKILPRRSGFYKRFYPNLVFSEKEQLILDILSHETQRDLLLFLIENPKTTQKHLSEYAKISPASIHWHMRTIIESGLVRVIRDGQSAMYEFVQNKAEVLNLLRSYHSNIWQTWADRLAVTVNAVSDASDPEGSGIVG